MEKAWKYFMISVIVQGAPYRRQTESRDSILTKKQIILLLTWVLVVSIGFTISYLKLKSDSSRQLTFEECEKAGDKAWRVDLYHPGICPACSEYGACAEKNEGASDMRAACPQVIPCAECMDRNFPYPERPTRAPR